MSELNSFSHAQKERLAFIDFSLQYFGQVARADLIDRFKTGLAASTRDLTSYRQLAPNNLTLRHQTKNYHRTDDFNPIFDHKPEAILTGLTRGFGDGISNNIEDNDYCINAINLVQLDTQIIAAIMRAIKGNNPISCQYASLSSGLSKKTLVPHAIANNGHRWHMRAYDRKHKEFRDFVCTRLKNIVVKQDESKEFERKAKDDQWNMIVPITLISHPSLVHKQAIEMDYGMVKGELKLESRAALLGYLLRHWNIDCSEDYSGGKEYQLALKNKECLDRVDSSLLAYRNDRDA